jgi:hypothetical protein
MTSPPLVNIDSCWNVETVLQKRPRKFHRDVGPRKIIHQNARRGKGNNKRAANIAIMGKYPGRRFLAGLSPFCRPTLIQVSRGSMRAYPVSAQAYYL